MNFEKDNIVSFENGKKVYILETMDYQGVKLAFVNEITENEEPTDTYKVMLVSNNNLQKVTNAEILSEVWPEFVKKLEEESN